MSELDDYRREREMERLMAAPGRLPHVVTARVVEREEEPVVMDERPHAEPRPASFGSTSFGKAPSLDALDDEEFELFVADEAKGKIPYQSAQLLRAPGIAARWYATVGKLMAEVNSQLAERAQHAAAFRAEHEDARGFETNYRRWRAGALRFRRALESRRLEAAPTAKRQKKDEHLERVTSERRQYRQALLRLYDFFGEEEPFVYSFWPKRDEMRGELEDLLWPQGKPGGDENL